MGQHKYSQKIKPKFVDADNEVRYIDTPNGGVRYMSNVRIGKRTDRTKGAITNIRGTLLVSNNYLFAGDNVCLGAITSENKRFIVFFNWNSNHNHGVYIYNPEFEEPIQLLYNDDIKNLVLGFHKYYKIDNTCVKIIQNKYLFFTDRYNSPRFLDINKALDYKKNKIFEIQQIAKDITSFDVFTFKYNGQIINTYNGVSEDIISSNNILNNYFDINKCGCSIQLTEKEPNTCFIDTTSDKLRIVPINFYPLKHHERQIDLVCYPQPNAPLVALKKDKKIKANFLSDNSWQFRVKIVYFDNNSSAWSAWSKVINTYDECSSTSNLVEIDYTDYVFNAFNDISQLHLVKEVVLGYRNTNTGGLYSFANIKQCDIPIGKQVYNFYNNITASAVSEYDDKIKQYDAVPLVCETLSAIDNRLIVGTPTENYNTDCFDFDVDVEYHNREKIENYNGKITGYIDIRQIISDEIDLEDFYIPIIKTQENTDKFLFSPYVENPQPSLHNGIADNCGYYMSNNGFIVYIAGTDKYTITKQIIPSGYGIDNIDKDTGIISCTSETNNHKLANIIKTKKPKIQQKFELSGLKDGIYIVRVASHWVGSDDKLGKGNAYDISNGLEWQNTSTNILATNGVINLFEATITIANGVQITDEPIFTVCNSDLMVNGAEQGALVQGYVIDSTSTTQSEIAKGQRIEHTCIDIRKHVATDIRNHSTLTDYNGYFWKICETRYLNTSIATVNYMFAYKDRLPNATLKHTIGMPTYSDTHGNLTVIGDKQGKIYKGTLSQLNAGTCVETNLNRNGSGENYFPKGAVNNYILPYNILDNIISKERRTIVKGRLVDVNGIPISGINVTALGTNRYDTTDINGEFGILLYSNSNEYENKLDTLLIMRGVNCNNVSEVRAVNIVLGENNYNNNNQYDLGDIQTLLDYSNITTNLYLKNGDTYDIGVTLMDRALRKSTVIHNPNKHRIRLPFTTEYIHDYFPNLTTDTDGNTITNTQKAIGYFTLKIKPKSTPPIWAVSMYVLRTQGQVYMNYVHTIVSDVKYVINYAEVVNPTTKEVTAEPVETTFDNHNANEIYLDLGTSFIEYQKRNSNSKQGWMFEKGDKLRFIYDNKGQMYDFIEVAIKEQRGNYYVIDNIDALGELKQGVIVEIFRQKQQVKDKQFFETSEYIKAINPYNYNREWEHKEITLNTGDAYRRSRKMYAYHKNTKNNNITEKSTVKIVEDNTCNDATSDRVCDIGRSDFINSDYKQLRRLATIRYGDTILTDSNINNIRRFDTEQQVTGDNNFGSITILSNFKDILFIAQERKCSTRYIGKANVKLDSSNFALSAPSSILSDVNYLSGGFGCITPSSYFECISSCVFYDAINGAVIEYYPQSGVNNISGYDERYRVSKKVDSIFKELSRKLSIIPLDILNRIININGIYDNENKEIVVNINGVDIKNGDNANNLSGLYRIPTDTEINNGILSYYATSNIGILDNKFKIFDKFNFDISINSFSYVYDDENKAWVGNRDCVPNVFSSLSSRIIGFNNAELHLLESGDNNSFGNFFGKKYKNKILVVMNIANSETKNFTNWSVEATDKWLNPNVEVINPRAFREIKSRTPSNMIVRKQGVFYAPFMFDINTPNIQNPLILGLPLIGEVLLLHLENDSDKETILYAVNIYGEYKGRSNS